MRNSTHQEAVAALIANVSLIKLLVRHDPPPKGLQVSLLAFHDFSFLFLFPFSVGVLESLLYNRRFCVSQTNWIIFKHEWVLSLVVCVGLYDVNGTEIKWAFSVLCPWVMHIKQFLMLHVDQRRFFIHSHSQSCKASLDFYVVYIWTIRIYRYVLSVPGSTLFCFPINADDAFS